MESFMKDRAKLAVSLSAVIFVLSVMPQAKAETTNCTAITTLPYVITTQGIYCFTGHLSTSMSSGNAIDIQTNNVTIDLNGYKLGGLAAGDGTQANGIHAYQRKNITIRNGSIRGFYRGIYLEDASPYTTSQGHLVEDILADNNTFAGIVVYGRGNTVRNNTIVDSSGSTVASWAYGIVAVGPSSEVLDNRVTTTVSSGSGSAQGIYVSTATGMVVSGNRVLDTVSPGGTAYGIQFYLSDAVTASNNVISTADLGLYFNTSTGKYMNNLTNNIATASYTGGTPVGTNN